MNMRLRFKNCPPFGEGSYHLIRRNCVLEKGDKMKETGTGACFSPDLMKCILKKSNM
jgi:hypothetical protein